MDIIPEGGGRGETDEITSVCVRRLWPYDDKAPSAGDYQWTSALVCVAASTGTIDVDTVQGAQYKYPLESYKRFRCPRSAPILVHKSQRLRPVPQGDPREHCYVHIQFDDDAKTIVLQTQLRERASVEPLLKGIEEVKKREIPQWGYQLSQHPELNLYLSFQSIEERDEFVRKLKHAKVRWLSHLKAEEEAEDLRTKRKVVDQYKALRNKIQDEHQKRLQAAAHAQAGQINAARENALECDAGLRLLYQDLVVSRSVLTPDEFWRRHQESLAGTIPLPQPSEEFFFPPNPQTSNAKQAAADQVSALLVESKLVQTKYDELVNGGKLTEEEFWSRLFQSRYYATLVGSSGSVAITKNEPYFDDAKIEDHVDEDLKSVMDPRSSVNTIIPATSNLAAQDHLQKPGFGTRGVTDLVTTATKGDHLAAPKRHPLTLMERFNRHASRALQNRHEYTVFYTGGSYEEQLNVDPVEDLAQQASSKQSIGLLAALVTLESSLERRPDVTKTNIIDTLHQQKKKLATQTFGIEDLTSKFAAKTKFNIDDIKGGGKRLTAMPVQPFVFVEYGKMMNEEIKTYQPDVNPMSNELTATVAFVKCTSALRGSSEIENDKLIREATSSNSLVLLFDSVADLQNKVKEILFHAYNPPPEGRSLESRQKLRQALLDLKIELQGLKRLEIDTTGHRKLTGIINTRTLTQPIVNAMDAALALPDLRNI